MLKLAGLALVFGFSAAAVSHAASINGLGNPLTDPLLVNGVQQGFDLVRSGEYRTLTLGSVTYTGVDGKFSVGRDYNGAYNTTGGKSIFNGDDDAPSRFRFDFTSTVRAFGFNFGASDSRWLLQAFSSTGVSLSSMVIDPVLGSNNGDYFGLSSSTSIGYALLTMVRENDHDGDDEHRNRSDDGDFVFIDRFTTSSRDTGQDVPLPAGLPLLASGITALFALRKRNKAS